MTAHHCEGLECGFFHIGMSATTCADGQSIANAVNVLVKMLVFKNIVRFTCNVGANLAKCQNLLENTVKIQEYLYAPSPYFR